MKKTIISLIVLILLVNVLFAEKKVIRIDKPNVREIGYILAKKFDIAAFVPDVYIDLVVDENDVSLISEKNILFYKSTSPLFKKKAGIIPHSLMMREVDSFVKM